MNTERVTTHAIDNDDENVNIILDGKWCAIIPKRSVEGVTMLLLEALK